MTIHGLILSQSQLPNSTWGPRVKINQWLLKIRGKKNQNIPSWNCCLKSIRKEGRSKEVLKALFKNKTRLLMGTGILSTGILIKIRRLNYINQRKRILSLISKTLEAHLKINQCLRITRISTKKVFCRSKSKTLSFWALLSSNLIKTNKNR